MSACNRTKPSNEAFLKRRLFNRFLFVIWFGLSWTVVTPFASALDVADYKWGFNGKVAPHRFNVLSVLLNNPTPQPYNGEVLLRKSLGGAGTVDATLVESVTLSPNSSKWIQFYPYITSDGGFSSENWRISYRGGSYDLPVPRVVRSNFISPTTCFRHL